MPILVNGEAVPYDLIREEAKRLQSRPDRKGDGTDPKFAERAWSAAEFAAVNRILIFQVAQRDPRPLDAGLVDREVDRQRAASGCRPGFDETALRLEIETTLRYKRAAEKIAGEVAKPTRKDALKFYRQYRENFRKPPSVRVRHVVKHVDEAQSEAEALAEIQAAETELNSGAPFTEVVANHSDCKDNGGDLGVFERGVMVEEFEEVVFSLKQGERSGIFRTPFGYHIAELIQLNADGIASFEDVRFDIERVMWAMVAQQRLLEGLEALRSQSTIVRASGQTAAAGG